MKDLEVVKELVDKLDFVDTVTNSNLEKMIKELKELLSSLSSLDSNISSNEENITKNIEILTQILNNLNIITQNSDYFVKNIKENKDLLENLFKQLVEYKANLQLDINTKLDEKLELYDEALNNMIIKTNHVAQAIAEEEAKHIWKILEETKKVADKTVDEMQEMQRKVSEKLKYVMMEANNNLKEKTEKQIAEMHEYMDYFLEDMAKQREEIENVTKFKKISYIASFVVGLGVAGFIGFSIGYYKTFKDIQSSIKTNIKTVQNIASANAIYTANGVDIGVDNGQKVVIINKKAKLCKFNDDYNEICY